MPPALASFRQRCIDLGEFRLVQQCAVQRVHTNQTRERVAASGHAAKSCMLRGSVTSTVCAPIFMKTSADELSAYTWYSGSGQMKISLPLGQRRGDPAAELLQVGHHVAVADSIAPLATPVVPPVYCRNASVVSVTAWAHPEARSRRASAALKSTVAPQATT
jgi:hypothetical protein